jgi:hypothetical protein
MNLDQQVRQLTKRPAERSVYSLGAGIRCDLDRQARQQPAQRLRPVALHTEEVLQLADHPFYNLVLAGRPTTIGLRPRPPGVIVRGGGHQRSVLLKPAPLPLQPREPFVRQVGFVTIPSHEGVAYGPLVGGGRGQPEDGNHPLRVYHKGYFEAVDRYGGLGSAGQAIMDKRYEKVMERFDEEIRNGQVRVHRTFSSSIYDDFEDHYFDWLSLDGNHLYEFVKQDLELYYPKVKPGGCIAGDDYGARGWWENGVQRAVEEFVQHKPGPKRACEAEQFGFVARREFENRSSEFRSDFPHPVAPGSGKVE